MKSDSVWVSTVDMDSSLVQLMSTDEDNALRAATTDVFRHAILTPETG